MGVSHSVVRVLAVGCLLASTVPAAARAPDTYEGLYKVKSKRFDLAYLKPHVDFRPYTKVMIDPPEVAFEKNWLRDYNTSQVGLSSRISDEDAAKMLEMARTGVADVYAKAFANGGYTVVTAPGPDVLRIRIAVINLRVNAPDTMSPGRTVSFSQEAGNASLVMEARDSSSGDLLGEAVDNRTVGDGPTYRRDSVTNRSDFEREFERWAKISVEALDNLKSLSPIDQEGNPAKK